MIDLSQVSDEEIKAEYFRRLGASRANRAGGPKEKPRACEICGQSFGARRLRVHTPACRALKARLYLNDKEQDGHPIELREKLDKLIENRNAHRLRKPAEIWLLDSEGGRAGLIGGLRKIQENGASKYEAWLNYPEC